MGKMGKKLLLALKKESDHYDLFTESGERRKSDSWNYYPRPQLKRDRYLILHDNWTLNQAPIRMPFPPESILSGYDGKLGKNLKYETTFSLPDTFIEEKILLHFGAVDQIAEVYVNGHFAGKHQGGYLHFTLDVTELVRKKEINHLEVRVTDSLSKEYPYGKQRKKRGGMWYTPISGIWQTVWLENVPTLYIQDIRLKPDLEGIHVELKTLESKGFLAEVFLDNGEVLKRNFTGKEGYLNLTDHVCENGTRYEPKLWTPEHPYLYTLRITTEQDQIETYFALRTISIEKIDGINRVCINKKPIFMHGVLDQGYYSDGIYLPAEPEEYERDILRMKELGFNMLRKHIKVEPDYFYYYCDKHGMLVVQDMINSGPYSFIRDTALPTIGMKTRKDRIRGQKKRKEIFKEHTRETISQLYNYPCIMTYTIFNEGWGQFDSDEMYEYVRSLDDSRLIDSTSGWFWQEKSDFDSEHIYFKNIELNPKERPMFLSECGGFSRTIEGHIYSKYNSYGYGTMATEEELTQAIVKMYEIMVVPAVEKGLCGCVYTQLSDVEEEVNGLYTYDRKVCKVAKEPMQQLAKKIFLIKS